MNSARGKIDLIFEVLLKKPTFSNVKSNLEPNRKISDFQNLKIKLIVDVAKGDT